MRDKETISKQQENYKKLEIENQSLTNIIIKLRNRLQLIKAQADEGFV